ncbi:hypothetical protein [Methylobacter sp.]|uniref:hypothetical protein n=1 Tax=Methylobacter sp. TaxID=2051955 RepID=UPI002FDDCD60
MKQITFACLIIVLAGSLTSNAVWARGGHGGGFGGGHHGGGGWGYGHGGYYSGIGLGLGLGYGLGYYGAPYYSPYYGYPPAVVTVPAAPPVYIQQTPPVIQQNPPGYWYYCNDPEGYYPYIKECFNRWQQVEPIPSAPR